MGLWEPSQIIENQFSVMSTTDQWVDAVVEDLASDDYYARTASILRLENDDFSSEVYDGKKLF